MNCLTCQIETTNPKYCSRSCAAKRNNTIFQKRRKIVRICVKCCKEHIPKRRNRLCELCAEQRHIPKKKPRDKNNGAVNRRRRKLKLMLIEYRGGKCVGCGYNRCPAAMDLHHVDPNTKEFVLSSKGLTKSWERLKTEADKCILLCANCHREHHAGIQSNWMST